MTRCRRPTRWRLIVPLYPMLSERFNRVRILCYTTPFHFEFGSSYPARLLVTEDPLTAIQFAEPTVRLEHSRLFYAHQCRWISRSRHAERCQIGRLQLNVDEVYKYRARAASAFLSVSVPLWSVSLWSENEEKRWHDDAGFQVLDLSPSRLVSRDRYFHRLVVLVLVIWWSRLIVKKDRASSRSHSKVDEEVSLRS